MRTYRSQQAQAGATRTRVLLGVWGAADVQSQHDGVVCNKTKNCLPDIPTSSTATLQPPALPPGSIQAMLVAE